VQSACYFHFLKTHQIVVLTSNTIFMFAGKGSQKIDRTRKRLATGGAQGGDEKIFLFCKGFLRFVSKEGARFSRFVLPEVRFGAPPVAPVLNQGVSGNTNPRA
jgi:hypothetical protein